jgi:aminoglycoside 6'-N-acetyltransferase
VITFRPVAETDLRLLHDWLHREHVKRWWRDEPTYDQVVEHYAQGDEDHFVIVVDGRDAGMIQTYLVASDPEWEAIVGAEPGLAGVDLLIGEEDLVGRGLGPQILAAFAHGVVFSRPGTAACVATVEEGNERSWRAFEKAGFRRVRDVEEEGRPHRLMRLERSE